MFVTFNILARIVRIHLGHTIATGTIVDIGSEQFLLTAAHNIEGYHAGSNIGLVGRRWHETPQILKKATRGDVALVKTSLEIDFSNLPLGLGTSGYGYGQEAFIAGFPAGQGRYIDHQTKDIGIQSELNPFLRRGIISNMSRNELIIDTLLQKGFSGGPLLVASQEDPRLPQLIGVVSSGLVFDEDLKLLDDRNSVTIRSGFTCCVQIDLALELAEDEFGIPRHGPDGAPNPAR